MHINTKTHGTKEGRTVVVWITYPVDSLARLVVRNENGSLDMELINGDVLGIGPCVRKGQLLRCWPECDGRVCLSSMTTCHAL